MLIGEFAKTGGVTREAVRHYVDIGLLKPSQRKAGARVYNDFSARDLERIKWISIGKSLGFTLNEIDHYLTLFMRDDLPRQNAAEMLREKRHEIDGKIAHLQSIRARIDDKLRKNYA